MESILRAQAERAVQTGAEFLDHEAPLLRPEIVPLDWHRLIDLNILDVHRDTRCVLAQIGQVSPYGFLHYAATARALYMEPFPLHHEGAAIARGFHAVPDEWAFDHYHALTMAWKRLILRRRAENPALSLVARAS